MNHYKLIENRPELTRAQVLEGMNFAAIQSSSVLPAKTLVKATSAKAVIVKLAISVAVLVSSVFILKKYSQEPGPNKQGIVLLQRNGSALDKDSMANEITSIEDTIKPPAKSTPKDKAVWKELHVTPVAKPVVATPVEEVAIATKKEEMEESVAVKQNTVAAKPLKPFKASPNVTCIIWNTTSFCNLPAKRDQTNISMECDDCEFSFVSCSELDKQPGIKAVWLVVTVPKNGEFKIKTAFKNFNLVRNSGEVINPVAMGVGISSEDVKAPKFYSSDFKTKKLTATFKEQLDIFLFFENPKPGDKIYIDDFIQAEIKE